MNNGGPAFPVALQINPGGDCEQESSPGMSLRDYFAAVALTGLIAAFMRDPIKPHDAEQCAGDAYVLADAMIAAREVSE